MSNALSVWQRLKRQVRVLPQTCANSFRFSLVPQLPRWFRVPASVRIGRRAVPLAAPDEPGISADFLTCVLWNTYGLGRRLGAVHTVLDIGANVGFFSLAARGRYPRAVIHVYEPNPRVLPFLRANTAGLDISLHPEAVSDRADWVTMVDTGPSNAAQTRAALEAGKGIRQISLTTAVERMGGRVDLLKMDCEGAEWEILRLDEGWEAIRNIRMEYHLFHGETVDQMVAALRAKGYRILSIGELNEVGGTIWAARD